MMRFHCLGTTGYHPNDRRQTACYFLPEAGLMLDAGSGLYRMLPLIETDTLDIFLSHAHLDHIIGLTYLLGILYKRPVERLRIWGEPEKLAAVREHLFNPLIFPVPIEAEWCPLIPGDSVEVGCGGRLQAFPLPHPGGSVGFRIDWPDASSIAYVTDTVGDPAADYLRIIRGCELLVHECYFRDVHQEWAEQTGHTWTTRAAQVAREAGAERLLLVHMNPFETGDDPVGIEAAREIFPQTTIAEDGMVLEV